MKNKATVAVKEERVSLAGLKSRGWTPALVQKFLGEPDRLVPNPHYRSGPKMRLYLLDRVVAAEQSTEYKNAILSKSASRKAARERAKISNQVKRTEVLEWVEALPINLVHCSDKELTRRAVEHYNALWDSRGECSKWASVKDDPKFLARITVNYLRHECTHYEIHLEQVFGKVGVDVARRRIKERVLEKIGILHGFLREECSRQNAEMRAEDLSYR